MFELSREVDELDARERWASWTATNDEVEIPARLDYLKEAAVAGFGGAALLYGVGAVFGWVVQGFKAK